MSVPMSLLAMLEERPMYGLELRTSFEEATGGVWPLNVGQVYTTLARLERDGLVDTTPEAEGHKTYLITAAGRARVGAWFSGPSAPQTETRDESVLKLLFAVRRPWVDVHAVIQAERRALIEHLQEYTRLKGEPAKDDDIAWPILLDSFLFKTEAQVRWLDACEARLSRSRRDATVARGTAHGAEVTGKNAVTATPDGAKK